MYYTVRSSSIVVVMRRRTRTDQTLQRASTISSVAIALGSINTPPISLLQKHQSRHCDVGRTAPCPFSSNPQDHHASLDSVEGICFAESAFAK
jgi:hypothetical protein